jgi:hypothetical protein
MAHRLGWVLYWACLALAAAYVLIVGSFIPIPPVSEHPGIALTVYGVPALALYGLGRAFRYVLSGE